jgi:hypothetical protein
MDPLLKQFLIKQAYTPPAFQGSLMPPNVSPTDTQAWGSALSKDLQAYGHLRPGSAEYNQAIKTRGFSPEYMQGLSSLGQRALQMSQDPAAVRGFASGNFSPYAGQLLQGIDPVQAVGGYANAARLGAGPTLQGVAAGATRLNANPFATTASGQWDPFGLRSGAQLGTVVGQSAANQQFSQMPQAIMGSLDRNSPLVRSLMANAATTHMSNKIDDWTSGMGSFGRQLRGLGQFLLGMGSRMPGYEFIANKAIDWFGPDMSGVFGKQSSLALAAPYSHYKVIKTQCGSEVLTPWNHR